MSKHSPAVLSRSIATLAAALVVTTLSAAKVRAASLYWDGSGTVWNATASWSTAVGATTPDPAAVPGAADEANFSISTITTAQTVNLNANQSALGLIFLGTNTAATTLQGSGANRTLSLGINGITVNTGAGAVTIGSGTANQNVSLSLQGSQSWTNNATSALTVVNGVSFGVAGANTLTLAGTSTATNTISGVVANGSGTLALSKSGTGTWVLSGANTFTGGTTVSAGTLRGTVAGAFGSNTGASAITLAGGNLDLFNDTGTTFANTNTTVTANSTVTANRSTSAATSTSHTLGNLSIGAQTLTVSRGANITGAGIGGITFGATTLTDNATFAPGASATLTLGSVSGAFGLTQNGAGTTVLSVGSTYSGGTTVSAGILQLNNYLSAGTGAITLNSGSTGRTLISGGVSLANNIVINSTAGTASTGFLQQTGTGQAIVLGTVTVTGAPTAGGTFLGGTAVGNELVINGAINGGGASQRDGRVIYGGGGSATGTLNVTNTALVGATNGLPQAWTVVLGGSGNATLDLNGFDQTLTGVQLGNVTAGNNNVGTVNLGAKTLTLNGDISTISTTTANATHVINATPGGTLNVGATNRSITVNNTLASDDLVINNALIKGSGSITKAGAGTLALNNVTVEGPLAVNAGTLQTGTLTQVGSVTSGSLAFGAGATTLKMKLGTAGDLITTGALTTGGTTTVTVGQLGGILPNGTYNLINYTGASPGVGGFSLTPVGHATASIVDTGSAIALNITGNDRVVWNGNNSTAWSTGATGNWKLQSSLAATDYIEEDDVVFQDGPASSSVAIAANVAPSNVTFNNTAATTYTVSGAAGIAGRTGLTKTGNGTVILSNPNSYLGATTVSAGTLELDHDATGNVVLSGTSGVSVAAGATLKLTRDDGGFTFNRNLSGAGLVELNGHSVGGTTAQSITLSGNNTDFTGTLRLAAPVSGTYRLNAVTPQGLGGASVEVQSGAQVFTAANQTYNNALTIAGTGFADASGNIGALRLENGSNWAGPIVVNGAARIGAHNTSATVSGNISGGDLTVNATNFNNSYTLTFTGNNTYDETIIGGQNTQTAGVPSMRLNIGNGGTTGTLGSGNVTIHGDGANGVLGFDRSDGYTLLPGQTITGSNGAGTIANSITRTFIDIDTLGAGFSDNGNTIALGTAGVRTGGSFRIAQARANAIANITGSLTAENIRVSSGQNGGVLNIGSGAVVSANFVGVGEANNMSGTINQATGSTVNIVGQLRVGHFQTNTSTYNMNGGVLQMTGASPTNSPSQAGAGNDTTIGDSNLNNTNPASVVGGGIYLGIDGTGIFNHNNGTVTTNWIVLDNRGDTGAGANMSDGIDRYNLNGGLLKLRSTYGLIQRNATAAVTFTGGTVQADNSGTGTGTGANLTIPLDANITAAGNTTLDTNGAGNAFSLPRSIDGNGTLTLTGGGSVNLSTTGVQNISAGFASGVTAASLVKTGSGTTSLTGNSSAFTGAVTVSAGRLNLSNNLGASSITVADGAALGGEANVSTASTTFGTAGTTTLFFDPNTPEVFTTGTLAVNGTTQLDFSSVPTGAGPWTAINYGSKTGGTPVLANASSYRNAPIVTATGSSVTVEVTGTKALTWTGSIGGNWDSGATANTNWNDGSGSTNFYTADTVKFDDTGTVTNVAVASGVSPWKTTIDSTAPKNYTLTSAGSGISGPGSLEKLGTSTLTLAGQNSYSGKTSIGGGTVSIAAVNSLGDGSSSNTIALSGGGRLNYSGTAAIDFGTSRSIDVGTGGGTISHSGATSSGITIAIPGNITGAGSLKFSTTGDSSTASQVSNYALSGSNSAYTGAITVEATARILSTLTFASQAAVPNASSITLLAPTGSTTTNNANTLSLPGVSLPAGTVLNMNAVAVSANLNLRTQIASTGLSTINGPVTLAGNGGSVIQFSPGNGTLTLNGDITETAPGSFGTVATAATVFFRNTGNTVVNGTINLPTANIVRVDDTGITTINSTGNVWAGTEVRSNSTLRLGVSNALPASAPLTIGQTSDNASSIFEMNGFDQTVNGLISLVGSGANSRRVSNSSTTLSTLTLDSSVDRTYGNSTGNTGGNITGNIAIVKNGTNTQTFAGPANTYTGNVTVNSGTLVAGGNASSNALGSPTTAGRVVTVNNGATLSLAANYVLGNGINNNNLPSIVVNGGTLSSTRYNVLGNITLNGATLTQASTDTAIYEGYQFRGDVVAGGASGSTIATTSNKGNHLNTNTEFHVANATGDSNADLTVSAPLRNQSGDFGGTAGGLTKMGEGTLLLSAVNTYTGPTVLAEGSLVVTGSIGGSTTTVNGGVLSGTGTLGNVLINPLGTLSPGLSPGTLTAADVTFAGGTLTLELNGTGAGQADQLVASGSVSLTSNTPLSISLGYAPVDNVDSFVVVSKTSAGAISTTGGLFTVGGTPLGEGALFTVSGQQFAISYQGGDGNDVVVTAVPEPGSITALVAGFGVLLGLRRPRRRAA